MNEMKSKSLSLLYIAQTRAESSLHSVEEFLQNLEKSINDF